MKKSLVVYDSKYGNTELVAKTIAAELSVNFENQLLYVEAVSDQDLMEAELLIIGSPTHGGRPTAMIQKLVDRIIDISTDQQKCACFDTRYAEENVDWNLRMLMNVIGFAAPKMAEKLEESGRQEVLAYEGFIVTERDGPLQSGELDRVRAWAQQVMARAENFSQE